MKMKEVELGTTIFIVGYHLALLIGLPFFFWFFSPSIGVWVSAFILLYLSGLSITAGYHRLYSHTSYKTNRWIEGFFLFFATVATQGSALKWASDHRKHHAYVDTDLDPYSINKGFWYAHMLWLFRKSNPIDKKVVADLYRNPLVLFQHKFYIPLMLLSNTLSFLFVGYLFNDYMSAFVLTWWVRLFFLHHFTWFINSLAHTWGAQSFSQEHSAVDNYVISLLTFGEGYHNYHHTFASDYRNGIRWYHFDPTKWMIWLLHRCGLAHNLRRVSHVRIKERIVIERKHELLLRLKNYWKSNKALLEEAVERMTADILIKFADFHRLVTEYKSHKSQPKPDKQMLKNLSLEIKSLKKGLKNDWRHWKKLSKDIMRLEPSLEIAKQTQI
ncbi:MAG: acyl-CoA desaturase [Anaerolineae bacterium]